MTFEVLSGPFLRVTFFVACFLLIHVLAEHVSAGAPPLPCADLEANELRSHSAPSSVCLTELNRGNVTVLYNWSGVDGGEDMSVNSVFKLSLRLHRGLVMSLWQSR